MLKEAIEKLVSLKDNRTYEIDGRTYSDNKLELIEPPMYRPSEKTVYSLDGIVQMIKTEIDQLNTPIFIEAQDYSQVNVYTTYGERMLRDNVYSARLDIPPMRTGWMNHEEAVIYLRSQFVRDSETDIDYVIRLLSRVSEDSTVKTEDNGVTQTVEARSGIAMIENVDVKPIVTLRPYRTFLEIKQPTSEFLFRLGEGGKFGIFEADGGMWKLEARRLIKQYFTENLADLIDAERVVVMI